MLTLTECSFRSAESVLVDSGRLKEEICGALNGFCPNGGTANEEIVAHIKDRLTVNGWEETQSTFFLLDSSPSRLRLMKGRTALIAEFDRPAYLGMDLLRFQILSPADMDQIDAGVYLLPTKRFQQEMLDDPRVKWTEALTFERVRLNLHYFKSAIQVPICILGIDSL